jgi:hypothetical protein
MQRGNACALSDAARVTFRGARTCGKRQIGSARFGSHQYRGRGGRKRRRRLFRSGNAAAPCSGARGSVLAHAAA